MITCFTSRVEGTIPQKGQLIAGIFFLASMLLFGNPLFAKLSPSTDDLNDGITSCNYINPDLADYEVYADPPAYIVNPASGKRVDLYYRGLKNLLPARLDIPNPQTVERVYVEVVYKGKTPTPNLHNAIEATLDDGSSVKLEGKLLRRGWGDNNSVAVFSAEVGKTSKINLDFEVEEGSAQSAMLYVLRSDQEVGIYQAGTYASEFGLNSTIDMSIPLINDNRTKDITITLPITEITTDGRQLDFNIRAGGVTKTFTKVYGQGYDFDNECCIDSVVTVLRGVPGGTSTVEISVTSPSTNGQSFVLSGIVMAHVRPTCSPLELDLPSDICTDNTVVIECASPGQGYTATWDFGEGAMPRTHTGFGTVFVMFTTEQRQEIKVSVVGPDCTSEEVHYVDVKQCSNSSCALEGALVVQHPAHGNDDGVIELDMCVTCGSTPPYRVFYTYRGEEFQAGPFNDTKPKLRNLKTGTYSNIYVIDGNNCQTNVTGPVTLCNGGCGRQPTCPDARCTLTGFNDRGNKRAFWLPSVGFSDPRWRWESATGDFIVTDDRNAVIEGRIVSIEDPSCGFEVTMLLRDRRSWNEWSSLGRSWKGNRSRITDNQHTSWDYYELVPGQSKLVGFGCFSGTLVLEPRPADYNFGVQVGEGANDQNLSPGLSAWFSYDGDLNGRHYNGEGDINVEGTCRLTDLRENATPIISCAPDFSVSCGGSPDDAPEPTINCGDPDAYTLTYSDREISQSPRKIERTWTAEGPGGPASCTQVLTFGDDVPPRFTSVPTQDRMTCGEVSAQTAEATDECGEVTIEFRETRFNEECAGSYDLRRVWTATDESGNTATAELIVHVVDETGPTFLAGPQDIVIECKEDLPTDQPTAVDDCGGQVEIEYSCTDCEAATPIYAWVDYELKYLTEEPDPGFTYPNQVRNLDFWNVCSDDPNQRKRWRVWNGNDFPIYINSVEVQGNEVYSGIVIPAKTQIYFFTRSSLGSTARIVWKDESGTEREMLKQASTEQCDLSPAETCTCVFTRKWIARDDCGNTSEYIQKIWRRDTKAPTLRNIPADRTYAAGTQIPGPANVTASDDCSSATVQLSEVNIQSSAYNCDEAALHLLYGSEAANLPLIKLGGKRFAIGDLPLTIAEQCDGSALITGSIYDVENPNAGFEINLNLNSKRNYSQHTAAGGNAPTSCSQTDKNTWTFYQIESTGSSFRGIGTNSGINLSVSNRNTNTWFQLGAGANRNNCKLGISGQLSYQTTSGNFNGSTGELRGSYNSITFEETEVCAENKTLIRIWSATDECGNRSIERQVIRILDETKPTFDNVPEDLVIDCSDPIPTVNVTATDNSGDDVVVTLTEEENGDNCHKTITRIWTAVDNCGNENTARQIITIEDKSSPTINFNNPIISALNSGDLLVLNCSDIPTIDESIASVIDNCDSEPTITFTDQQIGAGNCAQDGYRGRYRCTWTATDRCGNQTVFFLFVEIHDDEAPSFNQIPAAVSQSCGEPLPTTQPVVSDNCSDNPDVVESQQTVTGPCADTYQIIRLWTATDECGNTATASQVVSISDDASPELSDVPVAVSISCADAIPTNKPTATDNCDDNVRLVETTETIAGSSGCENTYTLIRLWTATDNCGNTATASQTVTVVDDVQPQLSFSNQLLQGFTNGQELVVDCDNIPIFTVGDVIVTDNCDTDVDVQFVDDLLGEGNCIDDGYVRLFECTWTATDNCGNTASISIRLRVQDTQIPTITSIPGAITISCEQQLPTSQPTITDNCTGDAAIEIVETSTQNPGSCVDNYEIIRVWTATDRCGNVASASQIITVQDQINPILAQIPESTTISCDQPMPSSLPIASDNCDADVTITVDEQNNANGCPGNYNVVRVFTATDNCGNTATASQVVTVRDLSAPTFAQVPEQISISCDENLPTSSPTVSDNCDPDVTLEETQTRRAGNCPDGYEVVRLWTATDNCGNSSTASQIISVSDTEAPVLASLPQNMSIRCDQDLPTDRPSATDNCDDDVNVSETQETIAGACENTYQVIRLFTATDNCGNSTTASQVISVVDEIAPVFSSVPANVNISCDGTIPVSQPSATDNCDGQVAVQETQENRPGNCPGSYEIIRLFTATDKCGNSATASQVVSVSDDVAPSFSYVPVNLAIACDQPIPTEAAIASDNCDQGLTIVETQETRPGNCAGTFDIVRLFTATDFCGNSATASQVVQVTDQEKPSFTNVPSNISISCEEALPTSSPVASDNCDQNVNVQLTEDRQDGGCDDTYIVVRRWTATDHCGNVATASQVVTVQDNTSPAFTSVPQDITISCSQTLPSDQPIASDNCDLDVSINETQRTEAGNCPGNYSVIRLWTATDNCGNSTTTQQVVTVEDRESPRFADVPQAITINCEDPLPSVGPNVTDNCDENVSINESQERRNGACPDSYEIIRTWTATDNCGNVATESQVVTVQDVSAPSFTFIPAEVTIACDASLPADQPEVSDNCDATVSVEETQQNETGDCPDSYTIIRLWTATDNCGNTNTATQRVNIVDEIAPVFASVPQATTVSCDDPLPTTQPLATDNCDSDVTVTEVQTTEPGNCTGNYVVLRIWTATDNCGNSTTTQQQVTVEDIEEPVFTKVPQAISLSCEDELPTDNAEARDNCDPNVSITETQDRQPGSCLGAFTVTRIFTATDDCGNVATASQIVTFQDNTSPVFSGVPGPITIQCNGSLPSDAPTASDNCDADVSITEEQQTLPGTCPDSYRVIRTWTATDECGNTASASQTVTVEDTEAPSFITVPQTITIECSDALPTDMAAATDNCDTDVAITESQRTETGTCADNYTVVRIFTATDNCGNTTTAEQRVLVEDTSNPSFTSVPQNVSINCDEDLPTALATASDNCDQQVSITETQIVEPGTCTDSYTVTRIFTATDNCGNTATASQLITVQDNASPTFIGVPQDVTISCDAALPTSAPTANDNCDTQVLIVEEQLTEQGTCEESYTVVRRWTATDNCGNSATAEQRVILTDDIAPILSNVPGPVTVSCDQPIPTDLPIARDNCDDDVSITEAQETLAGTCEDTYQIVRTFTATDGCGNSSTASQIVQVEDSDAPTFVTVPNAVTISCDETLPSDQPTATDNCDTDVSITQEEEFLPGICGGAYRVIRKWTATDNCGNASTATQLITVQDLSSPIFANVPADVDLSCDDEIPTDLPLATDNCDDDVHISETQQRLPGGCADTYTLIRTFTATDDCGNIATASQQVRISDGGAPSFVTVPQQIELSCDEELPTDQPTATDDCDGDVQISESQQTIAGNCPGAYQVIRTWTATDNCGNTATTSQIINVGDRNEPTFTNVPAETTISCDGDLPTDQPLAVDNCDTNVEIVETQATETGSCTDSYTVIRTWTATDDCGNVATASQKVNVEDSTSPIFASVPPAITIGCDQDFPTTQPQVTDNCDIDVVLDERTDRDRGDCEDSYSITRIWTATDNCGNTTTATQLVTIQDLEAPVFANVPTSVTINCEDAQPDSEPTATDNCDDEVRIRLDEKRVDGLCADSYELIRTWSAEDNCGNKATVSQVITVIDPISPTFASIPPAVTITCNEGLPTSQPVANDNCDTDVTISETQEVLPGACPDSYEVVRTWTITDNCGNTDRATQLVTVIDQGAPTFTSVPTSRTINCDEDPGDEDPIATDNCDTDVAITMTETTNGDNCAEGIQLIRIWTATDNCGNTASASQTITFEDREAPTFGPLDRTLTVECDQPIPLIIPTATDNCDREVDIMHFDNREDKPCGATITRTWVASDDCGNTSSATQLVVITDTQVPVLSGVPASAQLNCDDAIPPADVTATDNCTSGIIVQMEEFEIPGACPGEKVITRLWTAVDDCGNQATGSQTITITDGGTPVLQDVPQAVTISCNEDVPTTLPTATDNCGGGTSAVQITVDETTSPGNCSSNYRIIRVFTATDECGNISTASQVVTVVDDISPTFAAAPNNITLQCGEELPEATVTATDNCDTDVNVSVSLETIAGNCDDAYDIVRTWIATDDCGNSASVSQVVSFIDDVAPTFTSVPASLEITCDDPIPTDQAVATDACDQEVDLSVNEERIQGTSTNEYTLIRTWTAADNCGNTTTASQTITVISDGDPVFTFVPEDLTLSCEEDIPNADARATDNCDGDVNVTLDETRENGQCAAEYKLVRTWTAIDSDGNEATARQTITISDNAAPNFTQVPADITLTCGEDVPTTLATATDICDSDVVVTVDETRRGGSCASAYQILRTFKATDDCGNVTTAEQLVSFIDDEAPAFTFVPDSEEFQCSIGQPTQRAQATDNCTSNVLITFSDVSPSSDCSQRLQRIWTATDDCGNTATAIQQILLDDNENPELFGVPQNQTIDLTQGGTVPAPATVTANDNCDANPRVTFDENSQPAGGCGYVLTRTWTAFDQCGNTAVGTQRISVLDELGVSINVEPSDDCAPAGIQLNAIPGASGASYNWTSSNGGSFNNPNSANPVFIPNGPGTYVIGLTVQGPGCSGSDTETIEINGQSLTVGGGGTICLGETIALNATDGANSYTWIGPNGFSSSAQNPTLNNATLAATGVYTLTADFGTCTQEATVMVEVLDQSQLSVEVPELVCEGSIIELTAVGVSNATWTSPGGQTYTGSTISVGPVTFTSENGYWTVESTGSDACSASDRFSLKVIRKPVVTAGSNSPICSGGQLELFASGAATYAWSGPNGFTSNQDRPVIGDLSGYPAGSYNFTVIGTNVAGCTDTVVTAVQITDGGSFTLNVPSAGCVGEDLVFDAAGADSYLWSGPNNFASTQTSPTISNATVAASGTYTVIASFANNCEATRTFDLTVAEELVTNAVVSNRTCEGKGSIFLNLPGNQDDYTTNWTDLPGSENDADRPEVLQGTYILEISAYGCARTYTYIVEDECDWTGCTFVDLSEIAVVMPSCDQANGSISYPADTTGYDWTWLPNISNRERADNLAAGTYQLTITKRSDPTCNKTYNFTLNSVGAPVASIAEIRPTGCATSTGYARLEPSTLSFTYQDGFVGAERENMAPGRYTVTYGDGSGSCTGILEVVIEANNNLLAEAEIISQPSCGERNGVVKINVTSGSGAYTFSWGDTDQRSDVAAGTQSVTVVDNGTGCSRIVEFTTVDGSTGNNSIVAQDIVASCGSTASAQVQTTLDPNFARPARTQIKDSNGNIVPADQLTAGDFVAVLLDANACEVAQDPFTVSFSGSLAANVDVQGVECTADGIVTVTPANPGTFTITWSDQSSATTNLTRNDFAAGDYSFTLTSDNGCSLTQAFTVPNNCACQARNSVIRARDTEVCMTTNGAEIAVVTVTQPNIPQNFGCSFLLVEVGNAEIIRSNKTGEFVVSNTNTYSIHQLVFDSLGMDASAFGPGVDIPTLESMLIQGGGNICGALTTFGARVTTSECCIEPELVSVTSTDARCGALDGSVSIQVVGDISDYTYAWTPNLGTPLNQTGNVRGSLPTGSYSIRITNRANNDCFTETTAIVGASDIDAGLPSIRAATCGESNGVVNFATASRSLEFAWSDGGSGFFRQDLAGGVYTVEISDPSNPTCVETTTISVPQTADFGLTVRIDQDADCGQANGNATILAAGGSGNFDYDWGTSSTRNNLESGTYTVVVTDQVTSCTDSITFTINDAVTGGVDITVGDVELLCNGAMNGTPQFTLDYDDNFAFPPQISFVDSEGESATFGELGPGAYCIVIRDSNDCLAGSSCFTVAEPPSLTVNVTTTVAGCDDDGAISLDILGGTPPYNFDWADLPANDDPRDRVALNQGQYTVFITDANGCASTVNNIVIGRNCGCNPTLPVLAPFGDDVCLTGSQVFVGTSVVSMNTQPNISTSYLLADASGVILEVANTPAFFIDDLGSYTIHGLVYDPLSFNTNAIIVGSTTLAAINAQFVQGGGFICAGLDLNGTPVAVVACTGCDVVVGTLNSVSPTIWCTDDGLPSIVELTVSTSNGVISYLVVDDNNQVVSSSTIPTVEFEGLNAGVYTIYAVATTTAAEAPAVGGQFFPISGCIDLSAGIEVTALTGTDCGNSCQVSGGTLTSMVPSVVCITDLPSTVTVNASGITGPLRSYVITTMNGSILSIQDVDGTLELPATMSGQYRVFTVAYDQSISGLEVSRDIDNLAGCFDLSNALTLTVSAGAGCGQSVSSDTVNVVIPVNQTDTACFVLDPGFNQATTTYTLVGATGTSGQSGFGQFTLLPNGCIVYESGSVPGIDIDQVTVVASDGGLSDTTVFIISITSASPSTEIVSLDVTTGENGVACPAQIPAAFSNVSASLLIGGQTGSSNFGTFAIDPQTGCLSYDAGSFVGASIDTVVVVICDDALTACHEVTYIISVLPEGITTVRDVPQGDTLVICPPTDLLFGTVQTPTLCANPEEGTVTYNELTRCFIYTAPIDYVGPDSLCIEVCDDQGVCVQLTVQINVLAPCRDLVPDDEVAVQVSNCDSLGSYCLPISLASINDYVLTLNGEPYRNTSVGCNQGTGVEILVDTGAHVLTIFEITTGCTDTVNVNVGCNICDFSRTPAIIDLDDCNDPAFITLMLLQGVWDQYEFLLNGQDVRTSLLADGVFTRIPVDTGDNQLIIRALDNSCLEVIDVTVNCDGSNVGAGLVRIVGVSFTDTICLSDLNLGLDGSAITVADVCPGTIDGGQTDLVFDQASQCFFYTGLLTGVDSLCIEVCSSTACITFPLTVTVTPTTPSTENISINLDESGIICLDTSELSSPITEVFNFCPTASGDEVIFELDATTNCVTYTGINVGTEQSCFVLCNAIACDTVFINVTVNDNSGNVPPVAVDDNDATTKGMSIDINVLANDTLKGPLLQQPTPISLPQNGTLRILSDSTIRYTPNPDFCGGVDSFMYTISNGVAFDTATVIIEVTCDELVIFSGFSPNGDGVNDSWRILGIEAFPNNRVLIFNRWGNEVFNLRGYDNSDDTAFKGRWDSKTLPDGTYFYVIDLGEEAGCRSGYLQIVR